jgi:hypothetical protein
MASIVADILSRISWEPGPADAEDIRKRWCVGKDTYDLALKSLTNIFEALHTCLEDASPRQFEKMQLAERKMHIDASYAVAHALRETCPHDMAGTDSAWCRVCARTFGWRCPDSPDGVCHYFTVEGPGDPPDLRVELIDGRQVKLPEGVDTSYQTHDRCLYCGLPEERK